MPHVALSLGTTLLESSSYSLLALTSHYSASQQSANNFHILSRKVVTYCTSNWVSSLHLSFFLWNWNSRVLLMCYLSFFLYKFLGGSVWGFWIAVFLLNSNTIHLGFQICWTIIDILSISFAGIWLGLLDCFFFGKGLLDCLLPFNIFPIDNLVANLGSSVRSIGLALSLVTPMGVEQNPNWNAESLPQIT